MTVLQLDNEVKICKEPHAVKFSKVANLVSIDSAIIFRICYHLHVILDCANKSCAVA